MIGHIAGIPWGSGGGHLNDNTAYAPHITCPTIVLAPQYLKEIRLTQSGS